MVEVIAVSLVFSAEISFEFVAKDRNGELQQRLPPTFPVSGFNGVQDRGEA